MSKVNRKETKEIAAWIIKELKTKFPHFTGKQIRAAFSTAYAMLAEAPNA